MADIGTAGEEINAKQFKIYIGSTSNEWVYLQNAVVTISHPIFREPTTSGGVKTFTGAPDHSITGTMVFARDLWDDGTTNDFKSLLSISNGEVSKNSWLAEFTDVSGTKTGTTLTFANCKLSVIAISKAVEGGTKVDVTIVCPDEPSSV